MAACTQEQLDALRDGVTIDGVRYGPIEARLEREQGANVWLIFAIREGKNREVKNVLGHLGLAVNRLIRVSFGPFQLGDLPEGAVEEVRHAAARAARRAGRGIGGCGFLGADRRARGRRRSTAPTCRPAPRGAGESTSMPVRAAERARRQ